MAEREVLKCEEAGQFSVQARITLDAWKAAIDSFPMWKPLEKYSFRNKNRRYKWDSRKRCSKNGSDRFQFSRNAFRVFTLGELEIEENSGKMASWEFLTALPLLTKGWSRSIDDRMRTHIGKPLRGYVLQLQALLRLSIASVA